MTLGDPFTEKMAEWGRTQGTGDQRSGVSGQTARLLTPKSFISKLPAAEVGAALGEEGGALTLGLTLLLQGTQAATRDRSETPRTAHKEKTTLSSGNWESRPF